MTRKLTLLILAAILALLLGLAFLSSCSHGKSHGDSGDDDAAGDDDMGSDPPGDSLVWVQVTDDHQSRGSCNDKGHYDAWFAALQYIHDVIQPDFVVNTGDLADNECPIGQHKDDWDDYHNGVVNAGFTSADYYDLVGNHDAHHDHTYAHYLANSISGAADGQTMHSWTRQVGQYEYYFIGTLTAMDDTPHGFFQLPAYLWTESLLETADQAASVFVLAHHPDIKISTCDHEALAEDAGLFGTGGLLDLFKVTSFVGGHVHLDCEKAEWNSYTIATYNEYYGEEDMPPDHSGRMRIFVLTNGIWATRPKWVAGHGSQVIIAYPQDKRLSVPRNLNGYKVAGPTTIMAMAFGTTAPNLQMAVDGGTLVAMTTTDNRAYNATFDFGTVAAGTHTISVQDLNNDDATNGRDAITVVSH